MTAYYNEIEPFAAQWLRNLIAAGHIAHGVVDERDIRDIRPDELVAYTQCHFFAGIGGWSRALRLAGWPDDRPVWTGSCPCQPFSAAGKGAGFADERHLWPVFYRLIDECRPGVVFGEQVASKDGLEWLDLVQADLEASGYTNAAVDICAAGIGAPHIRQRLWWVADADRQQHDGRGLGGPGRRFERPDGGAVGGLAHHHHQRLQERERFAGFLGDEGGADTRKAAVGGSLYAVGVLADASGERRDGQQIQLHPGQPRQAGAEIAGDCRSDGMAQPDQVERGWGSADAQGQPDRQAGGWLESDGQPAGCGIRGVSGTEPIGPTNGFWRDADWLRCRDGKWRPVEPGTFPLAHGIPGRVGQLRAYGNAIVPQVAAEVIGAFMECRP